MRFALMIEPQQGLSYIDQLEIARHAEAGGFETLFRSDHYKTLDDGPDKGSLDAWATINALAAVTSTLRLGTLVSPATFRHPSVLAKMAVTADHASGGRIELGIGAGWFPNDHFTYGFPFHDTKERMQMLAEQLEIVHRSFREETFSFKGEHYTLEDCRAEPKPLQRPHLPVIVGGRGGPKSLALCARWGDEYNTVFSEPERCTEVRDGLLRAFETEERDPGEAHLSLMTGAVIGEDREALLRRASALAEKRGGDDAEAFLSSAGAEWIAGTVDLALEKLEALGAAGVERVMLQHLSHEDVEMVALIGREIVPEAASF
jgi:F420-dependent oxidoreductase-like protein